MTSRHHDNRTAAPAAAFLSSYHNITIITATRLINVTQSVTTKQQRNRENQKSVNQSDVRLQVILSFDQGAMRTQTVLAYQISAQLSRYFAPCKKLGNCRVKFRSTIFNYHLTPNLLYTCVWVCLPVCETTAYGLL